MSDAGQSALDGARVGQLVRRQCAGQVCKHLARLLRDWGATVELIADRRDCASDHRREGWAARQARRARWLGWSLAGLVLLLLDLALAAERHAGDLDREGEALRHLGEIFA